MNNGGPAFPVSTGSGFVEGMTLRDYFAGQAMANLLSEAAIVDGLVIQPPKLAQRCYELADAMLAAREKL